jgi:hypothetical protein
MSMESMQEILNWDFISVMMSQTVVVITVANTIGTVFKGKVSRTTAAFIASLMLTFYAAFKGGWSWQPGRVLEVLAYAVILFCLSAGTHQSVLAVASRVGARKDAEGPAGTPGRGGWWASWF